MKTNIENDNMMMMMKIWEVFNYTVIINIAWNFWFCAASENECEQERHILTWYYYIHTTNCIQLNKKNEYGQVKPLETMSDQRKQFTNNYKIFTSTKTSA